jgi:2-phospho-L-lactate guanylyltransferase
MADAVNIVVPVKGLGEGKSRLAGALSDDDRRTLIEHLVGRTLRIAATLGPEFSVYVISPDKAVERLARETAARFLRQDGNGLNPALTQAAKIIEPRRTVYLAADLPEVSADDIRVLVEISGIGIAPDERETGTNALSVPRPGSIPFRFGENSFQAHGEEAAKTPHPVTVVRRPGLSFDLDTKDDLSRLEGWP